MRQVFSSQRLENVESVAQMLRDADIEVRITNGRSYKGGRRGTFSYSDEAAPKAAVWVVRSDDTVRAREILREAGLLESTRESFAGPTFHLSSSETPAHVKSQTRALRIKLVLLAGIVVVGALAIMNVLKTDIPTEALKKHPLDGSLAAIPQPLAAAVFTQELPKARIDVLCLSIDGQDVSPELAQAMQQQLKDGKRQVVPASQCVRSANEDVGSKHRASGRPALMIDVHAFRPQTRDEKTGAITGLIEYTAYHHRMSASYKTLEVKQGESAWQVVRTVKHVAM
ncbi:hypothetical protein QLQ15_16575 [Lysobacter sp. LF1]|uniref:DUF2007 domain-containing protein n=1 Tax=Lysobacter stagni TaxID=3045172 RepID=A0ABT6XK17_9GAMM|nr:hypothetical protein [Lysobacter sp. LF1]MDI9240521.1 hypothetical protein [Lysobacter sp. LF1]